MDFIASAFYLVEFFLLWFNSKAVIDILEITNSDQTIEDEIATIPKNTRSLPSMIIFIATSKVLLLLTFNFALIYIYFVAAWKVCRENQKTVFKVTTTQKSKKKDKKVRDAQQPVNGTTIHRVESSTSSELNQPKVAVVKKTNKVEKEKNKKKIANDAQRDETELQTIHEYETSSTLEAKQPKPTPINKVEKVKKEKNYKLANDAPRDVTELPEIQLPRITYQRQPSQEEIPLPPPPSFYNKRNLKTKF